LKSFSFGYEIFIVTSSVKWYLSCIFIL